MNTEKVYEKSEIDEDDTHHVITRRWMCKKCGYQYLSMDPHPCPKCDPQGFEKYMKSES